MTNGKLALLLTSAALAMPNFDASAQTTIPGFTLGNMEVSEAGSANYTIPIQVPPGRSGMEPKLSLVYSSNGGNGIVGMGWSLQGVPSIHRCGRTPVQDGGVPQAVKYNETDRLCYGGARLVGVSGTYGTDVEAHYRTERESFTNVASFGNVEGGPTSLQLRNRTGLWMSFGGSGSSRVEAPDRAAVRMWAVNRMEDRFHNTIDFIYTEQQAFNLGEHRLARIDYGGNSATADTPFAKVEFVYENRPDVIRKYIWDSEIRTPVRLKNIITYLGTTKVKDYRLAYEVSPNTGRSRLISVTECSGDGTQCLVPLKFTYHNLAGNDSQTTTASLIPGLGGWRLVDVLNIGRQLFYTHDNAGNHSANRFKEKKGNGPDQTYTWATGAAGTPGVAGWDMGDLFGDGRSMFYTTSNDGTHRAVRFNADNTFTAYTWTGGHTVGNGGWTIADIFGDGRAVFFTFDTDGTNATYRASRLNPGSTTAENFTWTAPFTNVPVGVKWAMGDPLGDGRQVMVFVDNGTVSAIYLDPTKTAADHFAWVNADPGLPPDWKLADVFGEGRQLLYGVAADGAHIYARLQGGSSSFGRFVGLPPKLDVWEMADIFGDGRQIFTTHSAAGAHTAARINSDGTFTTWSWNDGIGQGPAGFRMGDVFGTGRSVYYTHNNAGTHQLSAAAPFITPTQPVDLLASVSVGVGQANVTVDYGRLTDSTVYTRDSNAVYPAKDVQGPLYVVRQLTQNDGAGNSQQTMYNYAGAKTHVTGGGFLGFRKFDATSVSTGIKVSNTFRQDYPFQGLPSSIVKTTIGGLVLSQVTNTYTDTLFPASVAGKHHRADLTQTVSSGSDLSGTALPSTTTTTSYDSFGNPLTINVATSDGFTKLTTNTYTNNSSNFWLLGRLTRSTVASTIPASMGGGTRTRTSGFEYSTTTGAIMREAIEPSDSNLCLVTAYAYDAYGNKTSVTTRNCNATSSGGLTEAAAPTGNAAFPPRSSTTQFQAGSVTINGVVYPYGVGRFATTSTNALNQSETRTFDPRFGGPLSLTGPNALTTSWTYDTFGRKASEARADGTSTTWSYAFCGTAPNYCGHSLTETATGAPTVTLHHDRLNRAFRKEVQGFDGTLVRTDTEFDALGRTYRASEPYYAGANPVWTTFTYDILGRSTTQTNPLGGVTTKSYNALVTTTTNPLGQVETQTRNSQGQVTRVTRQ